MNTRPRRARWRRALDRHLGTGLARYGFTAAAVVAVVNGLPVPALVAAALAALAWTAPRGNRPT